MRGCRFGFGWLAGWLTDQVADERPGLREVRLESGHQQILPVAVVQARLQGPLHLQAARQRPFPVQQLHRCRSNLIQRDREVSFCQRGHFDKSKLLNLLHHKIAMLARRAQQGALCRLLLQLGRRCIQLEK